MKEEKNTPKYLQVEDQSSLQMQQRGGFCIVDLQFMETLFQRSVQVHPLFTLSEYVSAQKITRGSNLLLSLGNSEFVLMFIHINNNR